MSVIPKTNYLRLEDVFNPPSDGVDLAGLEAALARVEQLTARSVGSGCLSQQMPGVGSGVASHLSHKLEFAQRFAEVAGPREPTAAGKVIRAAMGVVNFAAEKVVIPAGELMLNVGACMSSPMFVMQQQQLAREGAALVGSSIKQAVRPLLPVDAVCKRLEEEGISRNETVRAGSNLITVTLAVAPLGLRGIGRAAAVQSAQLAATQSVLISPLFRAQRLFCPLSETSPLNARIASSFRTATHSECVLDTDMVMHRVYSEPAAELGRYWTLDQPQGPLQAVIDFGLDQTWGNRATDVITIQVPRGTTVFVGVSAPQRGLVAGGTQVVIENVDPNWIVNRTKF